MNINPKGSKFTIDLKTIYRPTARERIMEGTSESTTVEKIYNYHIYIENIIKSFI